MEGITAILCDVDGCLVDTVNIHYTGLNKALLELDYTPISKDDEYKYNGLPTKEKLRMLIRANLISASDMPKLHSLKQKFTHSILSKQRKTKSILYEVLYSIKKYIPLAACSNALLTTTNIMLDRESLTELFTIILGGDSVSNTKPAPDIWLLAAELLNVDISKCIIIEDSVVGLQSALAANPKQIIKTSGPIDLNNKLHSLMVENKWQI